MVIYADVIFAINFVSAYIMLYILGKIINRVTPKKKRLLLASAFGAISSVAVFCMESPAWCMYTIRIISVFAMIFIAFFEFRKRLIHQFAWFLMLCGILMISMTFIAGMLGKTVGIVSKAGVLYFDISPGVFLLSFAGAYGVMILFIKLFKNRKNKRYYRMTVTHNNKSVSVTALFDSGNLLKEPITGKPVSILEWEKAKMLFNNNYVFSDLGNHIEEMRLWLIPFNSLGNPSGMLFGFLADSIYIPEEKKTIDKTFIAVYESRLSKNEEYHALINAGLL